MFVSAAAHFFVAVSGSFIHERMAQLFVDFYTLVDYATVYSADDIRITFKHGQEIKA